jgi:predicted TIM-barrel fold metal-dependent hydrolase
MEPPDWYLPYAEPGLRDRLRPAYDDDAATRKELDEHWKLQGDPAYRAEDGEQVWLRKNWRATGSLIAEDRPRALDFLGFASQLVFNTFTNKELVRVEHGGDVEYTYGLAGAHNRAMVDFCAVDGRLLAVGYVPLVDFELANKTAAEAITLGCKALMIPSACPPGHSPSHVSLDPVWAQAQEARLPVVFHVGGGGRLLDPNYFENGLPPVPDFHGGDGNFRSVDYMAIPYPPMQTLATMIIDGMLDRFPDLKVGVIEQGASWVPGWMRSMDSAAIAFVRNEERLQRLSLKPSEFVQRQVRVTPYPHEDAGWIIRNAGEEVCLFSSDYPHVEGGRNPLGRFEASLTGISEKAKQRFYCDNFADLMGPHLPA